MTLEEYKGAVEHRARELVGEKGFKKAIDRFDDYPRLVEWMFGNENNKENPNINHAAEDLLYWFKS